MPPLTGVGGLAELEQNAMRRFSPRRRRWKDVAAYDDQAAELEQRQAEVSRELNELLWAAANAARC
jgi:hypothetical protein